MTVDFVRSAACVNCNKERTKHSHRFVHYRKVSKLVYIHLYSLFIHIAPLLFDAPSPGNPHEYPHKPYIAVAGVLLFYYIVRRVS